MVLDALRTATGWSALDYPEFAHEIEIHFSSFLTWSAGQRCVMTVAFIGASRVRCAWTPARCGPKPDHVPSCMYTTLGIDRRILHD